LNKYNLYIRIFTKNLYKAEYFKLTEQGVFLYIYSKQIYAIIFWRIQMKVIPLADRVLVKIEKTESKTASGIIIPDTAQEKTQIAAVIAVGSDTEKIKVKAGQRVMYDKYAGTQVKIDGEEHLILKAEDVIAVIE